MKKCKASDYRIKKVELGKKTHAVGMHDTQHSVTSLAQRYDELLAKKDKLKEENVMSPNK